MPPLAIRVRTPALLALAALLSVALAPHVPARAEEDASEVSLERVETRLGWLERRLRRRSTARYAYDVMDDAGAAVDALTPPARPALLPLPADGDTAAVEEVARENKRRLARWRRATRRFEARQEKLLAQWVRLLGKALVIGARHPRDAMGLVLVLSGFPRGGSLGIQGRALELLVRTKRPDAAEAVMKAIEAWERSDAPWAFVRFYLAAFEALPRFTSPDVLDWLLDTFVGKEDEHAGGVTVVVRHAGGADEELQADLPVLALQALAHHDELPGDVRRDAVRRLLAAYAPVEERAPRGGPQGALWERVGEAAVDATWWLAGRPADGFAAMPPTMAELAAWFHEHRSPSDPAWQD